MPATISVDVPRRNRQSDSYYSDLNPALWRVPVYAENYTVTQPKPSRFKIRAPQLAVEIGGNFITISNDLIEIAKEIEQSRYILNLEKGWDDHSALPISKEIWNAATLLLISYSKQIAENFLAIIDAPEINPCPNGSIDISWRTEKARMLINVRKEKDEMMAYYYGDTYNNKLSIKGTVPAEGVEDHLASWMKNLV